MVQLMFFCIVNSYVCLFFRDVSIVSLSLGIFVLLFIKMDDLRKFIDIVKGIEGENDFFGKKYVWFKDLQMVFVKGWVVEELLGNKILVQCDDGSVSICFYYFGWYKLIIVIQ